MSVQVSRCFRERAKKKEEEVYVWVCVCVCYMLKIEQGNERSTSLNTKNRPNNQNDRKSQRKKYRGCFVSKYVCVWDCVYACYKQYIKGMKRNNVAGRVRWWWRSRPMRAAALFEKTHWCRCWQQQNRSNRVANGGGDTTCKKQIWEWERCSSIVYIYIKCKPWWGKLLCKHTARSERAHETNTESALRYVTRAIVTLCVRLQVSISFFEREFCPHSVPRV